MFRRKTNWKATVLKLIIFSVVFGFVSILLYFSLFAGLEGISSLIAKRFNLDTNTEIIKSTNSTFGAMLVAMATVYWNFANNEDKDKNKLIKKKVVMLHMLKRRFDKIQRNIEDINRFLLNHNLNVELKQTFKNNFIEIRKIEDEVIEMIVEIEDFNLYEKSNLFFETIYTEGVFETKNELKNYLLKLDGNIRELNEIVSLELTSHLNK
ncbi:hypothetical protein [Bacillus cereus]|uniref:hypothetical protein n=1 Tax=Bacillus cereus TaxID=1396 RepID=UPI000B4AF7B0|nr:hypothetical protein [Bacillus cereus]